MFSQTLALLRKDFLLEWRQKYALGGIVLYVCSTVFVTYYTFGQRIGEAPPMMKAAAQNISSQNASAWIAIFWIIVLFASVNAVAKSFVQENSNRQLYYYTLASPTAVILSKMIYNIVLLALLTLLAYGAFSFIMGNPVKASGLFFTLMFLGSVGLSIAFTFISAIAAKAANSATLMAILGFPVIVPILLTLVRLSRTALEITVDLHYYNDIFILLAIDVVLASIALILFPFLWRE